MDISLLVDETWRQYPGAVVAVFGLIVFWRGLRGGPNGERGLLRPEAGVIGRCEGFRVTVLGLALIGLGAAWVWWASWLLFLAVGIGFVELRESSMIIAAMKQGSGRRVSNRA